MIVNEWQLNSNLNTALQHARRADFALYLALLSPAVEESAEFLTPDVVSDVNKSEELHQRLGIRPARSFAIEQGDTKILCQHTKALLQGGLASLKLAASLNIPPLQQYDDKKRLSDDVWQSLSLHSRRRISEPKLIKPQADPAALYEVLQQLHPDEAA